MCIRDRGHSGFTVGGVRIEAQRIGLAVVGDVQAGAKAEVEKRIEYSFTEVR